MEISEFIDTYSDDIIYLLAGRSAVLTHPLRTETQELLDASTCRLLAVFMIGGIEVMLAQWRDRDHQKILDVYFTGRHSNGDRIRALCDAFQHAGITVDEQVFNDYLAIKYLRNTIVHSKWNEHERQWLLERGFPTDTRKLTKEHLDRMLHVNQNMMFYIVLTSVPRSGAKPSHLVKLDARITRQKDENGILRLRDLDRIIWNNLERIDALLDQEIERTATSEEYNWAKPWTNDDITAMSHEDRKHGLYLAARRASENNYVPLAQLRDLAPDALAFWQEYWQRAVLPRGLHDAAIQQSLAVLQNPAFAMLVEKAPWCFTIGIPEDESQQVLNYAYGDHAPFTGEQISNALRSGKLAHELFRNITPVTLFAVHLPIVDPTNTTAYLHEAKRALAAFRLNCAWYSLAEHHRAPNYEHLAFYDRMMAEFAQRR